MANVDTLEQEGMIEDADDLSQDAKDLINDLTSTEVQQLIDMWERLGEPAPASYGDEDFAGFVP